MSNYCNKGHWENGMKLSCKQCEIESLRQQLAEAQEQVDLQIPKEAFIQLKQQLAECQDEMAAYKRATELAYKGSDLETRQQLAECQATNGKLRSAMSLFLDSHEECEDFDGFTAQIVSMDDYHNAQDALALPNDATALNELIEERTAELTAQRDAAMLTLENCRLLAARNRNEDWAKNILRFCSEIGVNGNPLRTDAAIANCKEPK